MKRFQIMVVEYGSDHEVCLCETDTNPDAIAEAAKQKRLHVYKTERSTRKSNIPKYSGVRVVDHGQPKLI